MMPIPLNKKKKYIMNTEINELWDGMILHNLATQETLKIITSINGYTLETLLDVLYVVTGYRSWDQYLAE